MIIQNIFKSLIFVLFAIFCADTFSNETQKEDHASEVLFTQLADGRYVPIVKVQQKSHELDLPETSFVLKSDKEPLIQKIRNFFVTPFNFSVPIFGNTKKLYYRCEYQVTCAAQEFYQEVIPHSLFISKEQTVSIAHAYFFNLFGRLLTPTGICDALVSRILCTQIPALALKYNLSHITALCAHQGLYSLYTVLTKKVETAWYLFAFLYHISARSKINTYFKINRYTEMIVLGLCVPKMFNYLS